MTTSRALTLFLVMALLGLVLLALSVPIARAADPVVVRVTTSGRTTWRCGDQTNWSNPCNLQTALSNTVAGGELWVAAGTYTPTMGVTRTATFQLRDDIALFGGFAGGETLRSQRNFTEHLTILSGDLNGNDNSNVRYDEPTRAENSYHVITGSGVTNTAVLDGFTVTGGNGNSSYRNDRGGAMYNYQGSPTMANVTFSNNSALYGGAMYNQDNGPTLMNVAFSNNSARWDGGGICNVAASPMLTNVTFISNRAFSGAGMYNGIYSTPTLTNITFSSNRASDGGGMYNYQSKSTLLNVTFSGNSADWDGGGMHNKYASTTLANVTFSGNSAILGGGMYNDGGIPTLTNVTFSSNTTWDRGGGMYNDGSDPTLTNVTFSSNTAHWTGGGMQNHWSNPVLTNVTFSGNSADRTGGGMYNESNSSPTLTNTILWGNTAPTGPQLSNSSEVLDDTSSVNLSDSVVQGGCPDSRSTCTHIITADPGLGPLGNYGGSTQTIPLLTSSSAIDAGNDAICPATDQRGISRPQGLHCDIGAYESQGFVRLNLPFIKR